MLPGLSWLAQAIPQISERELDRDRLPDNLFLFLNACWIEHKTELAVMVVCLSI